MQFTFEFFRIRPSDGAHATLARVSREASNLDDAKTRAISLFETLNMPQTPDGLRIMDSDGAEVCLWKLGDR
jgi:hypothetical protein